MNYQEIERLKNLKKAWDSLQHYDTYKSLGDVEEAIKALQAILDLEQNFKKAVESLQCYTVYNTHVGVEEAIKALQAILDSEQKRQSTDID